MPLRFYNTLTQEVELFRPLEDNLVRMYTCGPTVYNYVHIGNFRTFTFQDILRRWLKYRGYQLNHVMNVTDVDDKIIAGAAREGKSIADYTAVYTKAFFEDAATLRLQQPEHVAPATKHIAQMVDAIEKLSAHGSTYTNDGSTYFRITTFPEYGKLSHNDFSGMKTGARVDVDEYDKADARDFVLWKARKGDEPYWDTPFGAGRPGWHIECSAMAMAYLGETLDIHAGGIDLVFPHHENEVAQSEAATGEPFVRFWLHSEHVSDSTGEKMSKSVGNIVTLRDLTDAGYGPLAVRFFLIGNAHYRSKLRLTETALHAAAEQVRRLQDLAERLRRLEPGLRSDDAALYEDALDARDAYLEALDDDLNLPAGLGHVFEVVRKANAALDAGVVGPASREALLHLLETVDAHLDVLRQEDVELDDELRSLIAEREQARQARDFSRADRIRDQLRNRGVLLEDTRQGVRWRRVER